MNKEHEYREKLKHANAEEDYEMNKEHEYREKLKHANAEEAERLKKEHEENLKKHKEHPKVNHPVCRLCFYSLLAALR